MCTPGNGACQGIFRTLATGFNANLLLFVLALRTSLVRILSRRSGVTTKDFAIFARSRDEKYLHADQAGVRPVKVITNIISPFFGHAASAQPLRWLQVSTRLTF